MPDSYVCYKAQSKKQIARKLDVCVPYGRQAGCWTARLAVF